MAVTDPIAELAMALLVLILAWHAGTAGLAIIQSMRRPPIRQKGYSPPVSIVVPVCGPCVALKASAKALAELTYRNKEVLFCAVARDTAAASAIAELDFAGQRRCIVQPTTSGNPKSALLNEAIALTAHELLLLTDDNVVYPAGIIEEYLSYRKRGYELVSACVVGDNPLNFWADVDAAFMNGQFARLQRAGNAIGLSFSTGKSMMVSKAALIRCGGFATAMDTMCEDAVVQRNLRRGGGLVTLSHATLRQPLGRRRFEEVWHRHLRWACCRRRHAPWLFVLEFVTSAPVAVAAGGWAAPALGIGFATSAAVTACMLLGLEWGFLRLAGWPSGSRYPLVWLMREAVALALWMAALRPRPSVRWRGQSIGLPP